MSLEPSRSQFLERRQNRALLIGLAISVVVHLGLLLIFRGTALPRSPFAAAGPRTGDARAAAGGGMQALQLHIPPAFIPRPPAPVFVEAPDMAPLEEEPQLSQPELDAISLEDLEGLAGTDPGPEVGPGLVTGEGTGDGGTAAEGNLRVIPPRPRGMLLPPTTDVPERLKGREITIWVFVNADGRVNPDSVIIRPESGDRGYDRRVKATAARWRFEPARKDGEPVAEWFMYTATLSG